MIIKWILEIISTLNRNIPGKEIAKATEKGIKRGNIRDPDPRINTGRGREKVGKAIESIEGGHTVRKVTQIPTIAEKKQRKNLQKNTEDKFIFKYARTTW